MHSFALLMIASFLYATCAQIIQPRANCDSNIPDTAKLPDPSTCARFLYCNNGVLLKLACSQNYYYDRYSGLCLYNPNCWYNIGPVDKGTATTNPCFNKSGVFVSSTISCNHYYHCLNELAIVQKCPFGYVFEKKNLMCVRSDKCL